LKFDIDRRNQYLKDEVKHGTAVAEINSVLGSSQIQATQQITGALVGMQNSRNNTLKTLGKAAAVTQITIDTAKGAVAAFTGAVALLGPIAGPIIGIPLAIAIGAYGAEKIGNVLSAQGGGVVPNTIGGARDRVPIMAEPGEVIIPKSLAPNFIQSQGRPDENIVPEEGQESNEINVVVGIEDDAADFLTAKQRENDALAIGVA